MDAGNLMGDACHSASSFYCTHVCVRSIEKAVEPTVAIHSAGTTVGVHSSVLVSVIVEPDGFGLSSGQDRATRGRNLGTDGICSGLLFFSEEGKASLELFEGDSASSAVLDFAESQVDVGGSELLVNELVVLGTFCETLAVHGGLSGSTVVGESLLELFWRVRLRFDHIDDYSNLNFDNLVSKPREISIHLLFLF